MPSIAASVAGAAEIGAAAAATGSPTARRVAVVVDLVRVALLRLVVAWEAVSAGTVVSAAMGVEVVSVAVGSGAAVSCAGVTVVSAVAVGVSTTSCASKGVEDKASTAAIAVRPERACFTG
jgi:hypothetical protein